MISQQIYVDSSVYRSLDDYMDEIREINSINYNRIYNGQQLIIPYYSSSFINFIKYFVWLQAGDIHPVPAAFFITS